MKKVFASNFALSTLKFRLIGWRTRRLTLAMPQIYNFGCLNVQKLNSQIKSKQEIVETRIAVSKSTFIAA